MLSHATTAPIRHSPLSWAPDGIHLAVTMYMAFGLNAGNSQGAAFDEVLLLDTTRPVSAANPTLIGPPATSMTGLRDQSDGKGWNDAVWLEGGQRLLALHLTSAMDTGVCMQPQAHPLEVTVIPVGGSTWADQALSQPPENTTSPELGVPYTCGAELLGVSQNGIALFIGSGPPRLEAWNTRNGSTSVQLIARNVGAATWESPSS